MLKIDNLKYKNILDIKNMEINSSSLTFITGPSGSGKSTLLYLLHGNDYTYTGNIIYNDKNLKNNDNNKLRSEIGYLSQHLCFFTKTIGEEMDYTAELLNTTFNKELILEMLQLVNLHYDLTTEITILSGGEQQRLAIARLLLTNKKVLLLDEPTSALDKENAELVIENLITYANKNNIQLIIVAHDIDLINKYSTNTIYLNKKEGNDGN